MCGRQQNTVDGNQDRTGPLLVAVISCQCNSKLRFLEACLRNSGKLAVSSEREHLEPISSFCGIRDISPFNSKATFYLIMFWGVFGKVKIFAFQQSHIFLSISWLNLLSGTFVIGGENMTFNRECVAIPILYTCALPWLNRVRSEEQ